MKIQIKTTVRYNYSPIKMYKAKKSDHVPHAGKDKEDLYLSCTVGRMVKHAFPLESLAIF